MAAKCPKCGASRSNPCRTASGNPAAKPHAGRSSRASSPRRRNPSARDREHVGQEALAKSEEYWDRYEENRSRTNFLVDSYKFLVIAHEELKYATDPSVRLAADHALKRAHAELSHRLKG